MRTEIIDISDIEHLVLFDPAPLLRSKRLLRIGYHALSVVFLVITITFAYAAVRLG